jgi:hypothetical protein
MSGLTYDDVGELFSTNDYLLEVELSLARNIRPAQRKQQLGDLQQCLDLLDHLRRQLPDPQFRTWAGQLHTKARTCIFRIQSLIVLDELLGEMQLPGRSSIPAA